MNEATRGWLVALAEAAPWPMPIRVDLGPVQPTEQATAASAALPPGPGVVALAHEDRGCVLVGATGDMRTFAAARLAGGGAKAKLAGAVHGLLACRVGSGFEADWAQAVLSREWTPGAHEAAVERARPWFVVLDPEGDVPVCRVSDSPDPGAGAGCVTGPFENRSAAEGWARGLEDRFELCREPGLLAQRPAARACVYKEMGRCPAPCDGSEPMESYRARARAALSLCARGVEAERAELERQIAGASASLDFEAAGMLRRELESLAAFSARGAAWATTLDRFGVLAVLPAGKTGWARLVRASASGIAHLCDVRAKEAGAVVGGELPRWLADGGRGVDPGLLGVVCGRVFSRRRTRSSYFRIEPSPAETDVVGAIHRAARLAGGDEEWFGGDAEPGVSR